MEQFEEVEAQRIRVVDEDGTLRMLLTAGPLPPGLFRGEPLASPARPAAGILFYNDEGTECGGLTFSGKTGPNGIEAGMSLTFDQYESDQVFVMQFSQAGEQRGYGISMIDRSPISIKDLAEQRSQIERLPEGGEKAEAFREFLSQNAAQRIFIGRRETGEAGLYLMDSKGRLRIRVAVDADDIPRLEFLDEDGKVTHSLQTPEMA